MDALDRLQEATGGAAFPRDRFTAWTLTVEGDQAWRFRVRGGPAALRAWRTFYELHPRTGLYPVILGDLTDYTLDMLTWRADALAGTGLPDDEDLPDVVELFVRWMGDVTADSYLRDIPKQIEKFDADRIKGFLSKRPDEAAVRALAGDAVHMALVPTEEGAKVPALLAWSGAEGAGHTGPDHLVVLRHWSGTHGANLVAMNGESLEFLVDRPADDGPGAFELAVQHHAYCHDLVELDAPNLAAVAAVCLGRHWYFTWR
jgi:hypothetical protein